MKVTLTKLDLEARKPVWMALSELWLDNELQDADLTYIARVIARSPYAIEQVKVIHRDEVAPALMGNLLGVAGQWAGFDEQWLEERCRANALRQHEPLRRVRIWLQAPILSYFTGRYWRELISRVRVLETRTS